MIVQSYLWPLTLNRVKGKRNCRSIFCVLCLGYASLKTLIAVAIEKLRATWDQSNECLWSSPTASDRWWNSVATMEIVWITFSLLTLTHSDSRSLGGYQRLLLFNFQKLAFEYVFHWGCVNMFVILDLFWALRSLLFCICLMLSSCGYDRFTETLVWFLVKKYTLND